MVIQTAVLSHSHPPIYLQCYVIQCFRATDTSFAITVCFNYARPVRAFRSYERESRKERKMREKF